MVGGGLRWLVSVEWGVDEETVVPLCFFGSCRFILCIMFMFGVWSCC